MEDGDLASGSDVKKKQNSDNEQAVLLNRIPTQAEIEKKCLRGVAGWLIRARVPPHSFMNRMDPILPFGVAQLEREVLKVHKERKDKAKKFLKSFDGKLTISYDPVAYDDEWVDYDEEWDCSSLDGPVLHRGFVCVSVHFIDHKLKVRKWILGYSPIESVRVAKVQVYRLRNVILDYGIEDNVSTILVPNHGDRGHKPFVALRKWTEKRGKKQIDPSFFRIYCCSDLFKLMAGDVFDNMDLLLEDIRVLVGWGKLTSTNWNVTLGSLQEALDMEDKKVFAEDPYYQEYDLPSDEDWIMIRTFCKLAGCIYKVAKELFEGEYSTSNVYFHLLAELKVMLNQELMSADNEYFRGKAKEVLERFDKYWNHMFLVLSTASVLDPRFKMKYLEFYCSKNQACDEALKAETVLDYLRKLYVQYAARDDRPQTERPDATIDSFSYTSDEGEQEEEESDSLSYTSEEGEEEESGNKEEAESDSLSYTSEEGEEEESGNKEEAEEDDEEEGGGGDRKHKEEKKPKPDAYDEFVFFQEYLKFEGSSSIEFDESELKSYLKEPVMEWNKDFKALEWWREESQKYPILSRIARDILSIPISCGKSYDAYVADNRECPEFVVTMKAKLVNAMMCSKRWSRF